MNYETKKSLHEIIALNEDSHITNKMTFHSKITQERIKMSRLKSEA